MCVTFACGHQNARCILLLRHVNVHSLRLVALDLAHWIAHHLVCIMCAQVRKAVVRREAVESQQRGGCQQYAHRKGRRCKLSGTKQVRLCDGGTLSYACAYRNRATAVVSIIIRPQMHTMNRCQCYSAQCHCSATIDNPNSTRTESATTAT